MKSIISVSRRTDIPAFYGDWFMNRLNEGFVGVVGPFGGRKYIVSLRQADVACFVFWSKNFAPFIDRLKTIEKSGYNFYFNYTVTGLPRIFESNLDKRLAIEVFKRLSEMYSAKHINWRYDPIIISSVTDYDFYVKNFESIARELAGYVQRCYFSYVVEYGKVRRNFAGFEKNCGVQIIEADKNLRTALANELAEIASVYGIQMYSCCGDYLVGQKINKAHCVDVAVIEELFYPEGLHYAQKPTREQCGCTESTDIGAYDTCPHGCIYCYANVNKPKAHSAYKKHDVGSAFLGHTKSESENWIAAIPAQKAASGGGRAELFRRQGL